MPITPGITPHSLDSSRWTPLYLYSTQPSDAEGNLISEYKRDTTAGNKALTTTYGYDDRGNLVVTTDAKGNQTSVTLPSGAVWLPRRPWPS